MAEIMRVAGVDEARRLVLQAYNTEIIANRLGRIENAGARSKLGPSSKTPMINLAIERVYEVVTLGF